MHNVNLAGFSLFLGFTLLLSGCGGENPNFKTAGSGTYDQKSNLLAEGNEEARLKHLIALTSSDESMKAGMACEQLSVLGAAAESAIPALEKVAKNHFNDRTKAAAQDAIDKIKADIAKGEAP